MSLRLALRALPARSARSLRPLPSLSQFSRSYATPVKPPSNPPPPAGLEGLFGGSDKKGGTTVAPKVPGSEPPAGPSQPKTPDVKLPDGEEGAEKPGEDVGEKPLKERRAKLSEQMMSGLTGKKTATGGGGGGDGGPGGGGPNQWGLTPNQLLLAVLA
jgi:AFG3 family protein